MTNHQALDEYRQVGKSTGATYADPHQLIQLLYDGALDRLAQAQGALDANKTSDCHRLVSETIGIVEGLDGCLDREAGGDLAENLHDLYIYVIRRSKRRLPLQNSLISLCVSGSTRLQSTSRYLPIYCLYFNTSAIDSSTHTRCRRQKSGKWPKRYASIDAVQTAYRRR